MLSIVFSCSSDFSHESSYFMRPKSLLSSICPFSIPSKVVSSLCILLKMCNGPLDLIKSTGAIFKSLNL